MTNTDRLAHRQELLYALRNAECAIGNMELKNFTGGLGYIQNTARHITAALASLAPAAVEVDAVERALKVWFGGKDPLPPYFDWTNYKDEMQAALAAAYPALTAQLAALTAQCEADKLNAARYRVVKESDEISVRVKKYIPDGTFHWQEIGFSELDDAIDSAIAAGNGEGVA